MDYATAIGLVSGIISFVETAGKILKLSWTIYNSVEGSSEETEMRSELTVDMTAMSKRIIPVNSPASNDDEKALIALAQRCNKLADDMKNELQSLKPKRRKSKIDSSLAALKTFWRKSKMEELEKQLQSCRDQLHFHISALASEDIKTLLKAYKEDGSKLTRLELSVTQLGQTLRDIGPMMVGSISDEALKQLQVLLHVGQDTLNEVVQDRILRGIKANFYNMSYRYENIESPFQDTFEWIFDLDGKSPEATKFTQWLSSGDGIFHICGKLGSGKSTLMKKLCAHARTRIELEKWMVARGGQELVISNFFFYALGSDSRQMSLIGLYRTLLYQILTTSPNLTQYIFPGQWAKALSQPKIQSAYEILDDDIRQAYERLSKQHDAHVLGGCCFGIFIDGLDEYQATTAIDRREMVRALADLANSSSGNFKICVSSRMENPFMDMFSETSRFYLHVLTELDMEKYVQGNLQDVGTKKQRGILASSITKKAEGVFLWVVLVVQKIRRRFDDGARFSGLLSEVESLPSEMDDLFQRILDTLETEDRRLMSHTVSLLHFYDTSSIAASDYLWPDLLDFYFLEDYEANPRFAESTIFPEAGSETVKESRIRARRQLRGVCRGLVEAGSDHKLEFVHRSVGDFFKQEKVRTEMYDASFNNMDALSQMKLAIIRYDWWDMERQNLGKDDNTKLKDEEHCRDYQSTQVTYLLEERRKYQLDVPPFSFLACLDTLPQASIRRTDNDTINHAKSAFRVGVFGTHFGSTFLVYPSEIGHIMPARHATTKKEYTETFESESSADLMQKVDEEIDVKSPGHIIYMFSPLFMELFSGRLEYPLWRLSNIPDMPLEPDKLTMLVYCAIQIGLGELSDFEGSAAERNSLTCTGLSFLQHLFERNIISPNTLTGLAYGGDSALSRVAFKTRNCLSGSSFCVGG